MVTIQDTRENVVYVYASHKARRNECKPIARFECYDADAGEKLRQALRDYVRDVDLD
jgi:hypothetical protein